MKKGEHPLFFYGQNYMGAIEAYLGAAAFRLFGVSVFSLRLGTTLLFTFFLICMYFLVGMLFNKSVMRRRRTVQDENEFDRRCCYTGDESSQ